MNEYSLKEPSRSMVDSATSQPQKEAKVTLKKLNRRVRNRAAQLIKAYRENEPTAELAKRNNLRTGIEYIARFEGLKALLAYVERNLPTGIIIDGGTGQGIGFSEIIQIFAPKTKYLGTSLRYSDSAKDRLAGNFITTSFEELRGIKPESVSGFLFLLSLCYSMTPELAIKRIDESLMPGGVIKGVFYYYDLLDRVFMTLFSKLPSEPFPKPHHSFTKVFEQLGYEIYVAREGEFDIVLARKPGGSATGVTLEELFMRDHESFINQMLELKDAAIKNYRDTAPVKS